MIKSVFINDLNEHKQNYKPSNGVQAECEGERGWQQEGQVGGKCRGPSKKEQAAAWGGGGRKGGSGMRGRQEATETTHKESSSTTGKGMVPRAPVVGTERTEALLLPGREAK